MKLRDIQISPITPKIEGQLSDSYYKNCRFCGKLVKTNLSVMRGCVNLSGDKFYCAFCLRHNHHFRTSKNILVFSYRGIIGYYHLKLYCAAKAHYAYPQLYLSDIIKMEQCHHEIGIRSPVLSYDPSTMLWFADFNRIGKDKNKAPYKEVERLAHKMLKVFQIDGFFGKGEEDFWEKFQSAIKVFYRQRKRPKDRRMLIPTLQGVVVDNYLNHDDWDATRGFVASDLALED